VADPATKVSQMVKKREKILEKYKNETGTVQEESNFTQAIDAWREVLQQFNDEQDKLRKSQEVAIDVDTAIATTQSFNMMRTLREKRPLGSSTDDQSSEDEVEETETSQSTPCPSTEHPRKRQKKLAEAAITSSTKEMVTAIKDMNKDLSKAVMTIADAFRSQNEKEMQLDNSWKSCIKMIEAKGKETKQMVRQLLNMMK